MKKYPFVYLASKSARRRELLREYGIRFRLVNSDFKEKTFTRDPKRTVKFNAIGKAKNAKVNSKKGIVIGADTLVSLSGTLFGKPRNKTHAIKMLKKLSGTTHQVYTGIALLDLKANKMRTAVIRSDVSMREFSNSKIKAYFSKVNPLDKAGAYAIQEHGDHLIKKIKGSYSNVVGLPMEKLLKILFSFS